MKQALTIFLLVAAAAGVGAASEPEMFGMGTRSSALGGTGAADAQGWEAAYLNPAALVGPKRRRLTLGYVLGRYSLRLDGAAHPVAHTDGLLLGVELPLPFGGVLRDRIALGLAFYFPTGLIARAQSPYLDQARLALLDDRTQVVSILVGAGIRLSDRITIGGGVLALAALVGDIHIMPEAGGHIGTAAEEQLVTNFTPVVGAQVVATRWLEVGAAFRGESISGYDITIDNNLGARLPVTLPTLRIAGVAQYDPMQAAVEAAFTLRRLTLVGGATWKHWSGYPNPTENVTMGAPPQAPPGFHDTAVPRIGAEWRVPAGRLELAARVGYFFEWSPAPAGGEVLLDANRHVVTGGAGISWHGRLLSLQLDLFGQWHHLANSSRVSGDFGVFGTSIGIDL